MRKSIFPAQIFLKVYLNYSNKNNYTLKTIQVNYIFDF